MRPSRETLKMIFAILIVLITVTVFAIYVLAPRLHPQFLTLDESIAHYVDSMASIEKGRVKIPVEQGMVKSVRVLYEEEGEKEGYEIAEDGWHVVVTYSLFTGRTEISASRIETYGKEPGAVTSIHDPRSVCILKREAEALPEVVKC